MTQENTITAIWSRLSRFQRLALAAIFYMAATTAMITLFRYRLDAVPTTLDFMLSRHWFGYWLAQCAVFAILSMVVAAASEKLEEAVVKKSPPILALFVISLGVVVALGSFVFNEIYQVGGLGSAAALTSENNNLVRAMYASACQKCATSHLGYLSILFGLLGLAIFVAVSVSVMLVTTLILRKTEDTDVPAIAVPGTAVEQAALQKKIDDKQTAIEYVKGTGQSVAEVLKDYEVKTKWQANLIETRQQTNDFRDGMLERHKVVSGLSGYNAQENAPGTLAASMNQAREVFSALADVVGQKSKPVTDLDQTISGAADLVTAAAKAVHMRFAEITQTLRNTHNQTVDDITGPEMLVPLVTRFQVEKHELEEALAMLRSKETKFVTPAVSPETHISFDDATLHLGANAHGKYRLSREIKDHRFLLFIVILTIAFLVMNNLLLAPELESGVKVRFDTWMIIGLILVAIAQIGAGLMAMLNIQREPKIAVANGVPPWLAFVIGLVPTVLAGIIAVSAWLVILFWPVAPMVYTKPERTSLQEVPLSCSGGRLWTYASEQQIDAVASKLSGCNLERALDDEQRTLVIVGMASQEGSNGGQFALAQKRVDALTVQLLAQNPGWNGSVIVINRGRHLPRALDGGAAAPYADIKLATGNQRPVIVLTDRVRQGKVLADHPTFGQQWRWFIGNLLKAKSVYPEAPQKPVVDTSGELKADLTALISAEKGSYGSCTVASYRHLNGRWIAVEDDIIKELCQ